ncbi:hypothetical protein E3P77_04029 [Wallemia ichthyophaga]|nr:hypothetical protein E3P77_04029 [Wallemia ichthyophaga]
MPALNFSRGVDDEHLIEKYDSPDPVDHDNQEAKVAYDKAYRARLRATYNWMPPETYLSRAYNIYNLSPLSKFKYRVDSSEMSERYGPANITPLINYSDLEHSLRSFVSSRHYVPIELIDVQINKGLDMALPGTIMFYIVCPSITAADGTNVLTTGDLEVSYNTDPPPKTWTNAARAQASEEYDKFLDECNRKKLAEDKRNRNETDDHRKMRNKQYDRVVSSKKEALLPDVPTLEEKYPSKTSVFVILPRSDPFENDPRDDPTIAKWPILLEGAMDSQVVQLFREWMGWRLNGVWSQSNLHTGHEIIDSFIENTWWYSEYYNVLPKRQNEFSVGWALPLQVGKNIDVVDITISHTQVSKLAKSGAREDNIPRLLPRIKEVLIRNTGLQLDRWIPVKATLCGITIDLSQKKRIRVNPTAHLSKDYEWNNDKEALEEFRLANFLRWLVAAFDQRSNTAAVERSLSRRETNVSFKKRPRVVKHVPGAKDRPAFKRPKIDKGARAQRIAEKSQIRGKEAELADGQEVEHEDKEGVESKGEDSQKVLEDAERERDIEGGYTEKKSKAAGATEKQTDGQDVAELTAEPTGAESEEADAEQESRKETDEKNKAGMIKTQRPRDSNTQIRYGKANKEEAEKELKKREARARRLREMTREDNGNVEESVQRLEERTAMEGRERRMTGVETESEEIAIAMDAAIGRIEQACQQFTHPGTRQQGENELLAMNEALSPNEIPLLTIAVLENSQEYYAHFHLLTLLITTISPNSSPEISQCLLSYILSDRAVPVYVSVKAHLALVKATSLENLVVILNNIRQSSPSAAVGISRAILEEQNINLDEDNELQTKSFEDNVLPVLSNIVLHSLTYSHDHNVIKYTIPALEALLLYRNDQKDFIYNTATDSMHISVLIQLASPQVLHLILSVNTFDNETLGFMMKKVLNAIFSSSHPQDKDGWSLSLVHYLENAECMDICTKLSCHKSLLQSRNLNVILEQKGEEYVQKLFQLGSASLSQGAEAFADFLACWLSILASLESNRIIIPIEMCTLIAKGWLENKASPLDNSQEVVEEELDDIETEMKVILDPLAQLSRMESLPILDNVTEKLNMYNMLIETSGFLSDCNYDRLQTLVLFAGSIIADEGIGETPLIPTQIISSEQTVSALSMLVRSLAKLTTLFSSDMGLSPNVSGIIWKCFWARYLRTYGLIDCLSLPPLQALNNVGFYVEFQKVIEHSLLKWKSEEEVVEGLADTIESLPTLPALINFGSIIDIVLSNMHDWPYKLDKKLVKSCGTYISKMDRKAEQTSQYKSRIFYFISVMLNVIENPEFGANSQRHPYITNVKMGLNALVGLSETLDPYTYIETVSFIKDVLSQLIGVVQQHYKARIDIQMDVLSIFYSIIQNMDLGLDYDESTLRALPQTYVAPILNMWFENYLSIKYETGMDDSDEFSEGVETTTKILRELAAVDGSASDVNNEKNFSLFVLSYLDPVFKISRTIIQSNLTLQSDSIDLACTVLRSYPRSINLRISSSEENFFNTTLLNILNQAITSHWNASYTLLDGMESFIKHSADRKHGANVLSQILTIPLNAILMRLTFSRTLKQRLIKFISTMLNYEDTNLWLNRDLILSTIIQNLRCPEGSKAALQASLQSALMTGLDLATYRNILNELSTHIANMRRV